MLRSIALALLLTALSTAALAVPTLASNSNCAAQFISTLAPVVRPFGTQVVVPEVRDLTLGGANLGQEVKALFATADRSACPITP